MQTRLHSGFRLYQATYFKGELSPFYIGIIRK